MTGSYSLHLISVPYHIEYEKSFYTCNLDEEFYIGFQFKYRYFEIL